MSDRPDWLPESTPMPTGDALPLWRRAVSVGLVAIAIMMLAAVFVIGGIIFSQTSYRPGHTYEKLHVFGFASIILCGTATILGAVAYLLRRKPRSSMTPVSKSRWLYFLLTTFVVVMVFGCWLGWNVTLFQRRQAMSREIIEEFNSRNRILAELGATGSGKIVYRSRTIQEGPSEPMTLSFVRRWLGDSLWTDIERNTEASAIKTAQLFPEGAVSYYLEPIGGMSPRHTAIIERAFGVDSERQSEP